MQNFGKKMIFFLSVAVTALGFAPISGSANNNTVLSGANVSVTSNAGEVKPLQLDKAVEDSKAGFFLQVAGHSSHYSHSSHSSHSSHRSGY